jgi:site-specific recombinase XerD
MDIEQIERQRKIALKTPLKKKAKRKVLWTGPIPGIRPIDIDAVSPKDAGLDCQHTLRVHRKMGKFEILPFNDKQLFQDTQAYIEGRKIAPEGRLFPFYRQDVLLAMQAHGTTVGGQTKIHPHALRRGGGIYMRSAGKMELEHLQAVYSHSNLSQTLAYIGVDKRTAFNKFAQAQKAKK